MHWVKINEEILSLERQKDMSPEWISKWNNLIKRSKGVLGCLKRDYYEENNTQTRGEEQIKEVGEGTDVAGVSPDMEEEKS